MFLYMDIEYSNIINEWYKGKSVEGIYNMIIDWIEKYPILLEIDEINTVNNCIDNHDSINDIVEDFIQTNIFHKINSLEIKYKYNYKSN